MQVLDRVLLKTGGDDWWSTLSGRVKAQNLVHAYQDNRLIDELKDASNYILCSNTKISLGKETIVKCKAEIDGKGIQELSSHGPSPLSGHIKIKRKLNKATDLKIEGKINPKLIQDFTSHSSLPLTASIDIGTPSNRPSSFRYRAGVRHATKRAASGPESNGRVSSEIQFQSDVALMGERDLWTWSARDSSPNEAGHVTQPSKVTPPYPPILPSTAIGPHNPLRQSLSNLLKGSLNGQKGEGGQAHGHSGNGNGGQQSKLLHIRPDQINEALLDSTSSISRLREDVQGLTKWMSSGSLVSRLDEAAKKGKGLKGRLHSLITDEGHKGSQRSPKGWSCVLPPSHFRVGGIMGLIARAKVDLPSRGLHMSKPRQENVVPPTPPQTPIPERVVGEVGKLLVETPTTSRQSSLPQYIKSSVTDWLQRGGMRAPGVFSSSSSGPRIHPYACGLASLQLGSMHRNILSFTRVTAKVDVGLISSNEAQEESLPRDKAKHALTLSCCQQLIGPVRLLCDLRFSLDSLCPYPPLVSSTAPLSNKKSSSKVIHGNGMVTRARQGAEEIGKHLIGMRPSLASVTYGLDVGVPGTSGMARLAAWYSPNRKEGMVEIRLF